MWEPAQSTTSNPMKCRASRDLHVNASGLKVHICQLFRVLKAEAKTATVTVHVCLQVDGHLLGSEVDTLDGLVTVLCAGCKW